MASIVLTSSTVDREVRRGLWKRIMCSLRNWNRCDVCRRHIGSNKACDKCQDFAVDVQTYTP